MAKHARRRRGGWTQDLALNLFTFAWLCRAAWRVRRGRAPWQAARRPARRAPSRR